MWFSANVFKLSYLRMKILLVCFAGKHLLGLLYATESTWKLWRRILGHSLMPVLTLSSWVFSCSSGTFLWRLFEKLEKTHAADSSEYIHVLKKLLFSEWAILMNFFLYIPIIQYKIISKRFLLSYIILCLGWGN